MTKRPSPTPPRPMDVMGILPVLRKLAAYPDGRLAKYCHMWAINAVTLGDCRKVKRWLMKMEKVK